MAIGSKKRQAEQDNSATLADLKITSADVAASTSAGASSSGADAGAAGASGSAESSSTGSSSAGGSRMQRLKPALMLYTSNHMENLADICALLMSEYPQSEVFAHEQIVVMNTGMRNFLTQRLAMQNQIASLCDYNQIWQLVFGIYRVLYPQATRIDLYNREHITWNIFSLLSQMLHHPPAPNVGAQFDIFFKLKQYLADDLYGDKAYELSAKIADTLDQYQMYRPQWILEWNDLPLRVFDEYERDPLNAQNPINIFIEDLCRTLARTHSGLKRNSSASADASSSVSTSTSATTTTSTASSSSATSSSSSTLADKSALSGRAGDELFVQQILEGNEREVISADRVQMIRSLLCNNIWQIKLWCMLRHNLLFFGRDDRLMLSPDSTELQWVLHHLDRAQIMTDMIACLKEEKLSARTAALLPERIFIFGVSALPKVIVQFLEALSHYCNVNVMLLDPCLDYRGDIVSKNARDFAAYVNLIKATTHSLKTKNKRLSSRFVSLPPDAFNRFYKPSDYDAITGERVTGNPLLLSLGRQGLDNFRLFYELDPVPNNVLCFSAPELPETAHPYSSSKRPVVLGEHTAPRVLHEMRGGNLLNYIQNQLMHLEQKPERYIIAPDDKSLQIHSCHTRRREVEILHDTILSYFNEAKLRGEKLYPRDIVVMVPAINNYAPHISAVFGGSYSADDPDYIPFVISDMTEDESNTVAQALLKLLEISTQRVTSSSVIELLSEESIARRFELRREDVEVLGTWLSEAHVYWGLDQNDVSSFAEIEIPGTFAQGLERMILGALIGEHETMPCFSEIEGSDSQILGKFWDFLQALRELRARFTPKLALTVDQWALELQKMLTTRFFADDASTLRALQAVLSVIDELQVIVSHLHYKPKINLPVFAAALRQGLVAQRNFQPFLREKINFCSLIPMRAVPFKHVFILGLNDRDFPREDNAPGFNLMGNRDFFEVGDRSRNIDDRYLFLEAIISARESLYLSYIGQSPVDKTELNPSVVLDELIYYICDHCAVENDLTLSDGERQKHVRERICKIEHLNAYQSENYIATTRASTAATSAASAGAASTDAQAEGVGEICKYMYTYPSFNRSFVQPSSEQKQDAPMLGAGVFFGEDFLQLQLNRVLELSDLMRFVTNPSRFFLRNLLGISFLHVDRLSQQEDEVFDLGSFETNLLVRELLYLPPAERDAFLERKALLGELPYGIFKQKLVHQVIEKAATLTTAMHDYLQVESLEEIQENSCPKSTWTILVPKRYFKGQSLPALDELIKPTLQVQGLLAGEGKNAVSAETAATASAALLGEHGSALARASALSVDAGGEEFYRFVLTLQANYHDRPFVLSTTSAMGELGKQKNGYERIGAELSFAYEAALTKSSLVFAALMEAIAYYLRYGQCKDVLILDAAGQAFTLKAFSSERMRYIINALLLFYVLNLSAPFPCCREVLRCLCFAPEEEVGLSGPGLVPLQEQQGSGALKITSTLDPSNYLNFAYDENSVYLYGSVTNLLKDPVLTSKAALFLDFYLGEIAPQLESLQPQTGSAL